MRQILTRPMIDAFAFGHDEYSDGMGRTYAEVDHDESYDVGRTVAEMPPAWRTLLRAAPDLLAALKDVEMRACQDRIASGIGRKSAKDTVRFLLGALERIQSAARAAIARATGGGA